MEQENEYLIDTSAEEAARQTVAEKKKPRAVWIVAAVVCAAVIAVAVLRSPPVRYGFAKAMMERGEYHDARQAFESLGDYKDAEKQVGEAEKGFVYLDAQSLLDQGKYSDALALYGSLGNFAQTRNKIREAKYLWAQELIGQDEWEEAKTLLSEIGPYRDAAELVVQLDNELRYKWAEINMVTEKYDAAEEEFRQLGDFRDAAEKAAECRRLGETKKAYDEGYRQYKDGKWLAAYRTLSPIRDMEYEDTLAMLEEIESVAEERARHYAGQKDHSKMLAFVQLAEEIDPETGGALRLELMGEGETFEKDQSYYLFDLAMPPFCTMETQAVDITEALLYMIIYAKPKHTILCQSTLDQEAMKNRVFEGEGLLCEVVPGYGSIYQTYTAVWPNGIELDLDHDQAYSAHQRNQHMTDYKAFCEQSLKELTELGLLHSSMSRRQKAEVLNNWVGFYLTYDKSLTIHDAGVAVTEAEGVCESYAGLYHRMCNLAGIPTYGQTGMAGSGASSAMHIWLFHVDEKGNIFYADPTWADPWDIDFSRDEEKPTAADFAEQYLEKCMIDAVTGYRYPTYSDGAGQRSNMYLWSKTLWSTHHNERTAEEIIAAHQKLLGNAA